MPFRTKALSEVPAAVPDVDIIFHGQLLLRPSADEKSCEVAVNPVAVKHILSIEARTKIPNQPDVIEMQHHGPLNFREPEGVTIEVEQAADPAFVFKCVGDGAPDYRTGEGAVSEDFRWVLNLEGDQFHNTALTCPIFTNRQNVINLKNGQYFFRTGIRSGQDLTYVRRLLGENPTDFKRIGAIARASVFLNPTQVVVMRWFDGTSERALNLRKVSGASHEIYIQNTPLFLPDSEAIGHDELAEYYKILPTVGADHRFTFHTVRQGGTRDKGTPTIPCQVVRLDGPGGN
jgi:hypothetical protein